MTEEQLAEFMRRGHAAQRAGGAVVNEYKKILVQDLMNTPTQRRNAHPEDDAQRAVCDFWRREYPDTWAKTFHAPNGLAAKNRKLAAIFSGLGVKSGVFDLLCIARRGAFAGFALELKSAHGSMRDKQNEWQARFLEEGWFTAIAFTVDVAYSAIRQYHAHPPLER